MDKKQIKILNLISDNQEVFEDAFLMKIPTNEEIKKAEVSLGFNIPDSYLWFLKQFGHGGFFFEFLGYGLNGIPLFVNATLKNRNRGLPENLMVIENCDEYVVCIDVVKNKIVTWSAYDKDGIVNKNVDFYDYFIDCIENAIDNY